MSKLKMSAAESKCLSFANVGFGLATESGGGYETIIVFINGGGRRDDLANQRAKWGIGVTGMAKFVEFLGAFVRRRV